MKNKFATKLESMVKPLSKIGQQRHLTSLRDGFALTVPFTIAGAMAILFITVVFGGWGASKTSILGFIAHASGSTTINYQNLTDAQNSWVFNETFTEIQKWGMSIFNWVNSSTLGLISIYVSLTLGYSVASVKRVKSPLISGAVSLSVFAVLTGVDKNLFGTHGMLTAIIAGLAGTELYLFLLNNKKLQIKMPASVPPAVGRSFSALFPAFLTLVAFSMLNIITSIPFMLLEDKKLIEGATLMPLAKTINLVILQPFLLFAKNGGDVAALYVYVLFVGILWFFGLHGSNTIDGAFAVIGLVLWIDNMNGGRNVAMGQVWNGFGFIGGSGATLSAIILSLILLKNGSPTKEVSKFALPAGIFGINEPVVFGYPIMFNIIWFIPFVFAPAISLIVPILAIKWGMMNAPTLISPWTMPPILYGLIVTRFDWRSIIVSVMAIGIQLAIWAPFVLAKRKSDEVEIFSKVKNNKVDGEENKVMVAND